ncbi:MAG: alpha-2-macroglobulin family protein [Alphaproteobacteria bacterium]|nr:alpha-2-macroglobulin family protein [Alphaproteobacteria bacterium]
MKINFTTKKFILWNAVILFACFGGYAAWYHLSQSYQIKTDTTPTAEISEIRVPQASLKPEPILVYFNQPAANIGKIGEDITDSLSVHPTVKGKWQWLSDSCLSFEPEISLIPDTEYEVTAAPEIFSPNIKIKDAEFSFKSPKFEGRNISSDFYENPQTGDKAVVASFSFNYPLNPQDIKDKINIKTVDGSSYGFTYKLDKENTVLNIISEPVKITSQENFATITVDGVSNIYNKKPLKDKVSAKIKIPSSSTFFQVKSISSSITRNSADNDNPEQIVAVGFTTAVKPTDLNGYFDLYFTGKDCYDTRTALADKNGFASLNPKKLKITEISANNGNFKNHIFKYDETTPFGCLIAVVKNGLKSSEGYIMQNGIISAVEYAGYPREVNIAASGAIMPLSGNHEAMFISRGVTKLHIKVARIAENNLNHLVTQTSGDFAHPFFTHYNFDENNISEVFEKDLAIHLAHPAKANYASLDLNDYFKNRKGVFFIRANGTSAEDYYSNTDTRLIVITDLGIVVKDDINGQHNIFVSDIAQEKPVAGATVEVLGKNGLPVLSVQTDQNGLAVIPDFSSFKNDKEAVVYKVSKNNDLSFLPINQNDRRLNLSRYDVGGQYDEQQGEYNLKGTVFSDRGIYRPGETANFGIVLRQNDLTVPARLPLVIEITNPNGDLVARQDIKTDNFGLMSYEYNIAQTAPTGIYYINLYVKNKDTNYFITSTPFKVDEFLPDNLRIKAEWQDIPAKGWTTAKTITAAVNLQNLYGTPAADHEIKASYTLTPTIFRFKEYAGYVFLAPQTDPNRRRETYQNTLPVIKTDDKGQAILNVDISQFEFGPYELRLFIDGLENGSGRGVKTSLASLASENDFLIGWKAGDDLNYISKGSPRKIDFVALNNKLETVNKDNLILKILRIETVSDLVEMPNGTYGYKMVQKETELSRQKWSVSATHTTETLPTDEAGDFALQVETSDGKLLAKAEWSVAGASNIAGQIDRNANLGLKLNRSEYTAGDEIEMQISAPYTGYGLITIEQDKVYAYKWFRTDTLSSIEKIKLPNTVEGNAYVNVALFRNIGSREIFMSPMSYAAIPFAINKSARRLSIDLDVPTTAKSGNDLVIKYKTNSDSKIIIYGVNQGILQVARYKLPDLLATFLPKKALRVITTQIMDLIMPDMRLLRTLSSSGGDDSYDALALDKNLNPFARKNSKPVAFWSGILSAGNETQEYRYSIPDEFNGEIKVMAVAVSADKLGSTEKAVKAHGDFAVLPSGPINVAPQDEFIVSVSIGNMVENSGNDYPIEVRVDNFDGFELTGSQVQTVNVSENGEAVVKFKFKTLNELGAKELSFTAQSKKDSKIKSHTSYPMSIRPATPYSSKFQMGHERSKFILKQIENLYPQYRTQQVSASSSPLVLASGLFAYLDKFPHFCTEQTVSKVFPATELLFRYPELVKNIDVYALFNDAMAKLQERQTIDGGFSAWNMPTAPAEPYASVYATHFLIKAKNYGFNVPQGMLNRALAYCAEQAARQPNGLHDFIPAYAAYVLTLNGTVTSNYLLNLEEYYKDNYPKNWQKELSASFMAASYKLLQNNQKADGLIDNYKDTDNARDNAINDYLTATHFPHLFADSSAQKIKALLSHLSDGNWTTSSAAWSTLALAATESKETDQSILFNGQKADKLTPFPTADFNSESQKVVVTADVPFYYVVSQLGFLEDNNIQASANGMEIQKTVYNAKGDIATSAKIGEELTVVINCRGLQKENIRDVAIVDLFSGGFEFVSNSLTSPWTADTTEVRDDRVNTYLTVTPQNSEIRYKVKAVAIGSFTVPPAFASALYQPLVRANSTISTIRIDE